MFFSCHETAQTSYEPNIWRKGRGAIPGRHFANCTLGKCELLFKHCLNLYNLVGTAKKLIKLIYGS